MFSKDSFNVSEDLLSLIMNIMLNGDDVSQLFEMSYLDYCKLQNTAIYKSFEIDNQESWETLERKLNRRDDINQKIELIKAETDKLLSYLESDTIAEQINLFNKPLNDLFSYFQTKSLQIQNDPEMREIIESNGGLAQNLQSIGNNIKAVSDIKSSNDNLEELHIDENLTKDELKKELENKDIFEFAPNTISGTEPSDIQNTKDGTYKTLFIHSQEQYYELLKTKERQLKGEVNTSLEMPESRIRRSNNDNLTSLSLEQTIFLFSILQEAKVVFNEKFYLSSFKFANSINMLTGYNTQNLRVANSEKDTITKFDKIVVQKKVQEILTLINSHLK